MIESDVRCHQSEIKRTQKSFIDQIKFESYSCLDIWGITISSKLLQPPPPIKQNKKALYSKPKTNLIEWEKNERKRKGEIISNLFYICL